jgi:hypothetical protein
MWVYGDVSAPLLTELPPRCKKTHVESNGYGHPKQR